MLDGPDRGFAPLLATFRGVDLETVHRGLVVIADAAGRLVWAAGDPRQTVLLRSAAKPFQAAAVVTGGAADAYALTQEELAVMASSHAGEERHVRLVAGLLGRLGLGPEALACGVHAPFNVTVAAGLVAAGRQPGPLQNNCSGKHAGMLALALAQGLDPADYTAADHPVQRFVTQVVADLAGLDPEGILDGTDGCGVPVFRMTALQAATLYARLAEGTHPTLARVRDAMLAYPELVGGEGRLDTRAMRAARGALVCKGGAGGVQGLGLVPDAGHPRGLGCFVKVGDGSSSPLPFLLAGFLNANGLSSASEEVVGPGGHAVHDLHGQVVGRVDVLVDFAG